MKINGIILLEREVRKMDREFWLTIVGLVMAIGLIATMILWAGGVI